MNADYAIIGGGIAGASVAYHLGKISDKKIVLFERQSLASETTYCSMGNLGPTGSDKIREMKEYGLQLYNKFFNNSVTNSTFELTGSIKVATSEESANQLLKETDGSADDPLEAESTVTQYFPEDTFREKAIIPYLNPSDVTATKYRPNNGFTTPSEVTHEFIKRAENCGVEIRQNSEVQQINTKNGEVNSLVVDGEQIKVDAVVSAAGPWNTAIADSVGVDLPVRNERAPVIRLDPDEGISYSFPYTYHQDTGIWFRGSLDGSVHIGYHNRNVQYEDLTRINPEKINETVSNEFIDKALSVVAKLYPFLSDADIVDEWVAVGSRTPDHKPIIGRTGIRGFSIISFHSQGIQLAPAAGKIIAQQLIENNQTEYYPSVSITRFDNYTDSFDR